MKSLLNVQKIFLGTLFFLFSCVMLNGQDTWFGNDPLGNAYRYGNTGIGTNNISALLHIMKTGSEQKTLRLQSAILGTFNNDIWDTDIHTNGSYNLGYTSSSSSPVSDKFTILKTGSVGIGTTNPTYLLHINGSTKINTNLYVDQSLGIGTTSPSQQLTISDPDQSVLRFERQGGKWDYEISVGGGGAMRFRGGANATGPASGNWADRMVITGRGRVGIGMSSVPSIDNANGEPYLLYVKGGILTEEVKVKTGWCDYVFESDYDLLTLEEVEDHISVQGHLHNTPSAKEIETNGLELKFMTVNQQEKIEELFLHAIELDKKMKALESENRDLETAVNTLTENK